MIPFDILGLAHVRNSSHPKSYSILNIASVRADSRILFGSRYHIFFSLVMPYTVSLHIHIHNQMMKHVTYEIFVMKENPSGITRRTLDFFHAHNGLLALHIEPTNGPLTIFGCLAAIYSKRP